jgi:prepilin-type N-terminal cleavage/methylation domain-containing protein
VSRRRVTPRHGFTLGELMIALVLFSLVGGAIISLLTRQQRFYRSTADIVRLQNQLRQGGTLLPLDLRGLSTADTSANGIAGARAVNYNTDIYARGEKEIDFRRVFGSSMLCAKPAVGATSIMIYPTALDSVTALTSLSHRPVAGDSLLVLDEGKLVGTADDVWRVHEVTGVALVKGINGCPWKTTVPLDSTPLLYGSDTVRLSMRVAISPGINGFNVTSGATVRFFRRTRYDLYRAADGKWYLGYVDCLSTHTTASKCSAPTPVSGPYEPYTGVASQNGLTFTYFDTSGNAVSASDPARLITRVDVTMRAASAGVVTQTGLGAGSQYRDSVLLSIGIRNRR